MDTESMNSQQSNNDRVIENYKAALTQRLEHEDENNHDQQISESLDSGDNAALNSGVGEFSRYEIWAWLKTYSCLPQTSSPPQLTLKFIEDLSKASELFHLMVLGEDIKHSRIVLSHFLDSTNYCINESSGMGMGISESNVMQLSQQVDYQTNA